MGVGLSFVWSDIGNALLCKRKSLEYACFLYGVEREENLEGCSFVLILDVMELKK